MKLIKTISIFGRVALGKIFNYKFPLRIKQYITYRCNLSCSFCGRKGSTETEMTCIQIKDMMREFKHMGTVFWEFTGGEPLLRQDLPELAYFAKDKMHFHLSMVTNGTLLPQVVQKQSSFLKKIDFVWLSIDGRKDINDKFRGSGVFDKAIEALKIFRRNNVKTKIGAVITKDNLQDYSYLLDLAKSFNAGISFEPIAVHPQDKSISARQFFPDTKSFKKFIDVLIKDKGQQKPLMSSWEYLRMVKDAWPDKPNTIKCNAGKFFCDITPEGYVVPCCIRMTNLKEDCQGLNYGFNNAFSNLGSFNDCNLPCYCSGPQEFNIAINMVPFKINRIIKNYYSKSVRGNL